MTSANFPAAYAPTGVGLLSADVGRAAPNRRADTRIVQTLLNTIAGDDPVETIPVLAPDGRFGPKTEHAIMAFEQRTLHRTTPTGRIRKDQSAVAALAAALPSRFCTQHLSVIMPNAPAGAARRFAGPLTMVFERHDLSTPLRQAHFLAQIGHESGELRYMEELASGAAYEGREDLGNTQPGDGRRFKGRGLIQLTGRANYTDFGTAIGRRADILASPTLVATDSALCVAAAAWFWSSRHLNALADQDDFRRITRRINGGYNGLTHRMALLRRAKAVMGDA